MPQSDLIWKKNLAALEERQPRLYKRLKDFVPQKYQKIILPNGLCDILSGSTRFYGDDPEAYAREAIEAYRRDHPKLIVLYGFGLGYILKNLLEDFGQNACHIIIVEHDIELVWHALHFMDWSEEIKGIRLEWFINTPLETVEAELREYLSHQDRFTFNKTLLPIYDKVSLSFEQNYYLSFAQKFKSAIDYHSTMLLSPPAEDTYLAYTNLIENMPSSLNVPSFHVLKGAFKNFPGILVSTGPSLEKHFDFLRSVNNRAVIICADSALRTLQKNGIEPHFVGTLERVTETKYFFENLEPTPNTWLLLTPIIWPETYSGYKGPRAHMMRSLGQMQYFWPEAEAQYTGNTCSHVGLIALRDMGCNPIILLGQDFAFDRYSEKTHAGIQPPTIAKVEGKVREHAQEAVNQGNDQWMVEGNNGEKILTSHWLRDFHIKTEDILSKMDVTCYNSIPADYGAKIAHTIRIEPSETHKYLGASKDVTGIIRSILKVPSENEQKEKHYFFKKQVQKALEELNFLQNMSLDMLASFSSYFNQFNTDFHPPEFYTPYLKKIDEVMDRLLFDPSRETFIKFFGPQFQETYLNLTVISHDLLTNKLSSEDKLFKQRNTIFRMFQNIHYWAARMQHFLNTHQECWDPDYTEVESNLEMESDTLNT